MLIQLKFVPRNIYYIYMTNLYYQSQIVVDSWNELQSIYSILLVFLAPSRFLLVKYSKPLLLIFCQQRGKNIAPQGQSPSRPTHRSQKYGKNTFSKNSQKKKRGGGREYSTSKTRDYPELFFKQLKIQAQLFSHLLGMRLFAPLPCPALVVC